MKIILNNKKRDSYESIYNIILTLVLAFSIIWIIYVSTPYSHYSLYLIETKQH